MASVDPALRKALQVNDTEALRPLLPASACASWSLDAPPVVVPCIVVFVVDGPLRVRLDRVLARGLGCPRSQVGRWVAEPLKGARPVRTGLRLTVRPPRPGGEG